MLSCYMEQERRMSNQQEEFARHIWDALADLKVWCKDCKYYSKHDKRCRVWNHGVNEWGFCYYRERREE